MICKNCKTIVSHRLTPSCIFSENLVEIFKILQEFQREITEFPSLLASVAESQPSLSFTFAPGSQWE